MMIGEIGLDLRPVAVIVADMLAPRAQRQHGRQLTHVLERVTQFPIALLEEGDKHADEECDHEEAHFVRRPHAKAPTPR